MPSVDQFGLYVKEHFIHEDLELQMLQGFFFSFFFKELKDYFSPGSSLFPQRFKVNEVH